MHNIHEYYDHLRYICSYSIAWKFVIFTWHDIFVILKSCMGLGCHPDSVAVIPRGQLME